MYAVSGAEWAEPDVEDAAAWLKRLFGDAALRAALGAAGQRHALKTLGREALDEALADNGIG